MARLTMELAKDLLLTPLIYIRLLGILCSIIVFGCVADKVQQGFLLPTGTIIPCAYDGDNNACNFAIAVGVIGFLFCLAFLVKDVMLVAIDFSNDLVIKKVIILVDAVVNGLWAFMWFVCFAYTADRLRKAGGNSGSGAVVNCARSGIAFSFFSILIWIAIVVVNFVLFVRITKGNDRDYQRGGYASFPEPSGEGGEVAGGGQQYSPPEY